ncbi:hypothetical protein BCR33DRAFT_716372 [Rhizoclosmatium globosum]|uniref:RGS domain-containing protein n=1 Tax=Rhizoclosmatium globosum TaxID=329046 RepID=A0A1Y2CFN9_9FUNG|nr:hypothetical protein BCR33DRAFT_716372 [Rhizoclosmatium globosum]|eukprot:ORY45746.1 hypothetical protein BCR33DRAFT_716372 [Rhizoclosmatium globosum]
MSFQPSIADILFFVLWLPIGCISTLMFYLRRSKRNIATRSVKIQLIQAICTIIATIFLRIDTVTKDVPCFVELWIFHLTLIPWTAAVLLRCLHLHIAHRFNQIVLYGGPIGAKFSSRNLIESHKDEFGFVISNPATSPEGIAVTAPTKAEPSIRESMIMRPDETTKPGSVTAKGHVHAASDKPKSECQGLFSGAYSTSSLPHLSKVASKAVLPQNNSALDIQQPEEEVVDVVDSQVEKWMGAGTGNENERVALLKLEKALILSLLIALVVCVVVQIFSKTHRIAPVMAFPVCVVDFEYIFAFSYMVVQTLQIGFRIHRTFRGIFNIGFKLGQCLRCFDLLVSVVLGAVIGVYGAICSVNKNVCEKFNEMDLVVIVLIICHITSVITPIALTYIHERKMRIKKLVMNLTCFHSASEECFFWETYKDLYLSVMKYIKNHHYEYIESWCKCASPQHEPSRSTVPTPPSINTPVYHSSRVSRLTNYHRDTVGTSANLDPMHNRSIPSSVQSPSIQSPSIYSASQQSLNQIDKQIDSGGHMSLQLQIQNLAQKNASLGGSLHSLTPEMTGLEVPPELVPKYVAFYKRFCCEGAPCEVNLSASVKVALKKKMKKGKWFVGDFEMAKEEVVNSMYMSIYPRWMASKNSGDSKIITS